MTGPREETLAPDVVAIAGGGVVGLAIAFELSERGVPVRLFEAAATTGSGATRAAGGMLAPVAEAETEDPEGTALGLDSAARYPDFVRRVEAASGRPCDFRTDGTWWVALDRDDAEQLEHLAATLAGRGLAHRRLEPAELREREPHLSPRAVAGLELAGDRQVDPRKLAAALTAALEARGAGVERGVPVRAVRPAGRGIALELAAGRVVRAARAVVAAGSASDALLPEGARIGLRPVKGQLLRLSGPPLLRRVVRTPDVYLIPRPGGELLVGATVEEMGEDVAPTAGAAHDLLRFAFRALPGVYDLRFDEISVGLRPATPDHRPAIGETGHPGLFVAAGHHRNGVLLAPATAAHLAGWIAGDGVPDALAAFRPGARAASAGAES